MVGASEVGGAKNSPTCNSTTKLRPKWPVAKGDNRGIWWKTTPLATQPSSNFSKKKRTISFLGPGANVDLGPVGEWAKQNGGGKKSRQNIKTSPLVFTFFLFAFRTTSKRQFGFA